MQQPSAPSSGFDLSDAVSLASAAFSAYDYPVENQQGKMYSMDESTISFIDKNVLQETFYGLLSLRIVRSANLRDAVPFRKPEPFSVLFVEWPSLSARSRARRFPSSNPSNNPTWDPSKSQLYIPIRDPKSDTVRVQLYDTLLTSTPELGFAVLRLSFLVGHPAEQEVTLQMEGPGVNKSGSTVTLSVRLRAFADCTPAELNAVTLVDTVPPDMQPGAAVALGAMDTLKPFGATTDSSRPAVSTTSWPAIQKMLGGQAARRMEPVAFLENIGTDTQAWIFRDLATQRLSLAFRGTEKINDWMTNLKFSQGKLTDLLSLGSQSFLGSAEAGVHVGFFKAYKSVRGTTCALIDLISSGGFASSAPWRLMITGHSLGGALATLAAYDFAVQKAEYEKAKGPSRMSMVLYTYGCPRVGNQAFADDANRLMPNICWRIMNFFDVVVSLPPWNSYASVGTAVMVGDDKRLLFNPSEQPLLQKLISKKGTSDHMEPRYQDTLLRAVQGALSAAPSPISKL